MSALISSGMAWRGGNDYALLRLTFAKPGPIRVLRWVLPKVPNAGLAKAAGLNHMAWERCETPGSPTCSGYSVEPALKAAVSPGSIPPATELWMTGVNGTPPGHWKRLETRQPPAI